MEDAKFITVIVADLVVTVLAVALIAAALVRVMERSQKNMMQIALSEQRQHYLSELQRRDVEIDRLKHEVATLERLLNAKFPLEFGAPGE